MGNTIAKQLAKQAELPKSPTEELSLESDLVDFDISGDSDLESLMEITGDIDQQFDVIDRGICVEEGLTGLVDSFIGKFDDEGVDEASASLLEVSVEAYLRVSGINVPVRTFLPEWQSASTYSAEVVDKKNNFIGRLLRWLHMALESVRNALNRFWDGLVVNVKAIKGYAEKVKKLVDAIPMQNRTTPSGDIALGKSALWLTDRNGTIRSPQTQVIESVTRFDDFVREWADIWKPVINVPDNVTQALTHLNDAITDSHLARPGKYDITSTHYVRYQPGSGDIPMLSAKVEIGTDISDDSKVAPILNYTDMRDGIESVFAAFKELDAIKKQIDVYTRSANKVKGWANSADKTLTVSSEISGREIVSSGKSLSKACMLASWGLTHPTSYYLKTIKACIRYIEASANRY